MAAARAAGSLLRRLSVVRSDGACGSSVLQRHGVRQVSAWSQSQSQDAQDHVQAASTAAGDGGSGVADLPGADGLFNVLHAPVDAAVAVLDGVHSITGMPWWLTIASSTVALRAMLFPLTVIQLKKAAQLGRMRSLLPSLLPSKGINSGLVERYRLFTKRRVELGAPSPAWIIAAPLVQVPLFISWILAVRQMALAPYPGFDVGGAFWFADLTVPGQGVLGAIFPMVVAWAYFLNLQMSFKGVESQTGLTATFMKFYKWGLEAVTIPTLLIAFYLPQGVFMYWVPNNVCSLVQTVSLQQPGIRQKVGLPPLSEMKSGSGRPALSKEENVGTQSTTSDQLILLAANHVAKGQPEEAIKLLKQAVMENPECAEAFNALGKLHTQKKQWAEAVDFYNSAISKSRNDELLIAAYFGAGIALHSQGKSEEAIAALRKVASLEMPGEPRSQRRYFQALVTLGSTLSKQGLKQEALQILRRAAQYDPMIDNLYVRGLEQELKVKRS